MRSPSPFLACLLLGFVAACQSEPPLRVAAALRASPDLAVERPADIAILPIEDATVARSFGVLEGRMRQGLVTRLAERLYSPLAPQHVDQKLREAGKLATGSPVDAAWLGGVKGTCGEDAVLGVRITHWDVSKIMETRRVQFAAEVLMLGARSGALLWSGRIEGSAKSGGEGPAPLGREQRVESAVDVVADALARELPPRGGS